MTVNRTTVNQTTVEGEQPLFAHSVAHQQLPLAGASLLGNPFLPHRLLRFGNLQTALALMKPKPTPVYHVDQPFLVDGGPDHCDSAVTRQRSRHVQLLAYYTPRLSAREGEPTQIASTHAITPEVKQRGLVLLLHGWLGCSHSTYNLLTTTTLTAAGFDVVRLNFRDHGPDVHLPVHTLNPGIFLGTLLEEILYTAQTIAQLAGDHPFYIIGVSMGGNFALRLALQHARQPIPNLRKVIAINPAVDPANSTDNVDRNPMFRRYFRRRWLNSLLSKQARYPDLYDFDELRTYRTIRGMTERIIARYGPRLGGFQSADEYFASYAVPLAALSNLTVSTEIITALDDPIINAADFGDLPSHPKLSFQPHPTGGHVGYVNLFPLQHHLPQLVLQSLID